MFAVENNNQLSCMGTVIINGFHYSDVARGLVPWFNALSRLTTKEASNLRITGLRERNPPVTGGFPSQMATNAECVSMSRRYHILMLCWKPTSFHLCSHFQSICLVRATQMEMPSLSKFPMEIPPMKLIKRLWQIICDHLSDIQMNIYLQI